MIRGGGVRLMPSGDPLQATVKIAVILHIAMSFMKTSLRQAYGSRLRVSAGISRAPKYGFSLVLLTA